MARFKDLRVGRILAEDGDFITLEIGKRDDVPFHLQQDETGNVVGGDRFLTLVFVRSVDGRVETWDPFEGGNNVEG